MYNCLEILLFLTSESSLIIVAYMSVIICLRFTRVHFAKEQTSIHLIRFMSIWIVTLTLGVVRQVVLKTGQYDTFDFYCMPVYISPTLISDLSIEQRCRLAVNILCLLVMFISKLILLAHIRNVKRNMKKFDTFKKNRSISAKSIFLILYEILIWCPSLLLELLILSEVYIDRLSFLLSSLFVYSVNSILYPILALESLFLRQRS